MQTNYLSKKTKAGTTSLTKLLLGLLLVTSQISFSQAVNYGFSQSTGTYTELTDANVLIEATALTGTGSIDDQSFPAVAIPFNFPFCGNTFSTVNVHANGFISFGTNVPSGSTPISNSVTTFDGAISALATDLHALYNLNGYTGNISTKLEGTTPNQEFVIQWKNFRPYLSSSSTTSLFNWSFQIRLREDGLIKIVYDLKVNGTPSSATAQVGLRGTTSADYNTRYAGGTTSSNWMSTTAGGGNTSAVTCNSTSLPTSGYTFIWTPPSPCATPVSQPTNLAFTIEGIIVTGNFTASSPAADKYLVLRTPQGTTPNAPANGTNYATGDNATLNARVIYNGPNTTFTDNAFSGVIGNTAYTYTVFAVSSSCTGGPFYNSIQPLSADTITCPGPINQLISSNPTTTAFNLSWTPNNGNAQPYNYILEIATDTAFANQITGSPFTVQSTETTFQAIGLTASTKYYYRIKAVSTCTGIYSSIGNTTTLCAPIAALNETFTGTTTSNPPSCWTVTGWEVGSIRGAGGSNGATNIYKNLYSSAPTGTFTTVTIGPIAENSELSFDYKQSAFSSPYAPLATWGNFNVQISTNSGTTWTTIATIENEAGTGSYIHKAYPLTDYAGQYVTVKITSNRTAGDFDLSFDNFKIATQSLGTGDFLVNNFKFYPNPTSGIVNIQTDLEIKTVSIYNHLGQLVSIQDNAPIDLSNVSTGIYIIRVDFENGQTANQKVIKK